MTDAPRGAPHAAPSPDPRATRNAQLKARFEAIRAGKQIPRVRVLPANEEMRRILKHPRGMAFRSAGSVEWPNDKFTQRRLAEGSITLEQRQAPQHPSRGETRSG